MMTVFGTEFPLCREITRGEFISQVILWLRGMEYSSVLNDVEGRDLDVNDACLVSTSGETLRFRCFDDCDGYDGIGFRHDFPDSDGRVWRTEVVLRKSCDGAGDNIARFRTECRAADPKAKLETPKKPYLIKSIISDSWPGDDGLMSVSDKPIFLLDCPDDLEIARIICNGSASTYLPIIYISSISKMRWLIGREKIEKLAYDLGGVAHVVVEPDRLFSLKLRDLTDGGNIYGGHIGVFAPGMGLMKRLFVGWEFSDERMLIHNLRLISINIRSRMASLGWDWIDLQEACLRSQRLRERNKLTDAEFEEMYLEEICEKNERIDELNKRISEMMIASAQTSVSCDQLMDQKLVRKVGPEIYDGEFSDRIRLAVETCLSHRELDGLDKRSIAVFRRVIEAYPFSRQLDELKSDLKRACKDPKRMAGEITALLRRHGYAEKSDNKHIRLQANDGYMGLDSITLPKTPSDYHSSKNQCKDIEKTLGITKLSN